MKRSKKRILFGAGTFLVLVGVGVVSTDTGWRLAKEVLRKTAIWVGYDDPFWVQHDPVPGEDPATYSQTFLSPEFHVDKIYPSMAGPSSKYFFNLGESGKQELMWITGYHTEVQDEDSDEPVSDEFMCHNNLDFARGQYYARWGLEYRNEVQSSRLMTMTQGQTDLEFPPGFGVPVMSDDVLSIAAQVLNHNDPNADRYVRHQSRLDYILDRESTSEIKPLFQQSAVMFAVVADEEYEKMDANIAQCAPAPASISHSWKDEKGLTYTGHWMLPPGRDSRSVDVTEMLALPFETNLHYVAVHLHPFADTMELRDLTADSVVVRALASSYREKTGLKEIQYLSFPEGIPFYPDHQYELTCISNNTSGKDQDMMGVMLLYFHDKEMEAAIRKYQQER